MDKFGFLLYGFLEKDAEILKKHFIGILRNNVMIISASACEDYTVKKILESGGINKFESSDTKILLFLGFDDNSIQTILQHYPKELSRPIFCCLTDQNINWKFSHLIEHLEEEKKYWENKSKS